MKLSHMTRAYNLAQERRNAALMLEEVLNGDGEVTVGGWPLDLDDDGLITKLLDSTADLLRAEIADLDQKLAALGVVADIEPEDYANRYPNDGCGDPRCGVCGTEIDDDDDSSDAGSDAVDTAGLVTPQANEVAA